MSLLQQYITMSEAGFSLTAFAQLAIVSGAGFVAVKAVARQSAPLRSLVSLTALASLAMTLAVSAAFHFSNISWCKTERIHFTEMPSIGAAARPASPASDQNIATSSLKALPQKRGFEISNENIAVVLAVIWLAGTAFMSLKLVYGLIFLHGFKYGLTPVKDARFDALLKIAAGRFGKNKVPQLYTSSRLESPITMGISSPIVIIPEKLIGNLSEAEMKSILLHELAHIYSCDHLAGVFKRLVIAANWWNPLVYIISAWHSIAREEVADNHVLLELHPKAYSECLAGLAEKTCLINSFPAAAGMAGKYSSLEQRVKKILSKKRRLVVKTSKRTRVAAFLGCCILATSIAGVQHASAQDNQNRTNNKKEPYKMQHASAQDNQNRTNNKKESYRMSITAKQSTSIKGGYSVAIKIFEKDFTGKDLVVAEPNVIVTEGNSWWFLPIENRGVAPRVIVAAPSMQGGVGAAPDVIVTKVNSEIITVINEKTGDGIYFNVDSKNWEVKVTAYKQEGGQKKFELSDAVKVEMQKK